MQPYCEEYLREYGNDKNDIKSVGSFPVSDHGLVQFLVSGPSSILFFPTDPVFSYKIVKSPVFILV